MVTESVNIKFAETLKFSEARIEELLKSKDESKRIIKETEGKIDLMNDKVKDK